MNSVSQKAVPQLSFSLFRKLIIRRDMVNKNLHSASRENDMDMRGNSVQKHITSLLMQADKYVKEGKLAEALEKINSARTQDPRHLYAIAYEERVKSMLQKRGNSLQDAKSRATMLPKETDLYLSRLSGAKPEVLSPVQIAAENLTNRTEQDQRKHEVNKSEKENLISTEEHRQFLLKKIEAYLLRAQNFFHKNEYNKALDEIARAYLLDPFNKEARALEEKVRRAIAWNFAESIALKSKILAEREKKKQETQSAEEENHRAALMQKVNFLISRISAFIEKKEYNRAMEEISRAYILDPGNSQLPVLEERVLSMRQAVNDAVVEKEQYSLEKGKAQCLDRVAALLSSSRLEEALNELAAAVVRDPFNRHLLSVERAIIEAQHRQLHDREKYCIEIASGIISQK